MNLADEAAQPIRTPEPVVSPAQPLIARYELAACLLADAAWQVQQADAEVASVEFENSPASMRETVVKRGRLRALRLAAAARHVEEFAGWSRAAGWHVGTGAKADDRQLRTEAAWEWCLSGCPEHAPCRQCGRQCEYVHNKAEPENNIEAFEGRVCEDGHWEAGADIVREVCRVPVISDVR